MDRVDITIVGAGIIGLALAAELSSPDKSIFVIERNETFGMETSSRNSEVIHSGIYYPTGSLKHTLCMKGNGMLYNLLRRTNINFNQTGKYIVAVSEEELPDLYSLFLNAKKNDIPGIELVSSVIMKDIEPSVKCKEAVFSPTDGIIDTHKVMEYFQFLAKENGAEISYKTELKGLEKTAGGYIVSVKDSDGALFKFESETVINSAGLNSDSVAQLLGIDLDSEGYRLRYCKGSYFRLSCATGIKHLIYPVVRKDSVSLGVHVTIDLGGGVRLGPDVEYINGRDKDYTVDENKRTIFHNLASKFIDEIKIDDIYPDTAGIRPKLQGPDEEFRDFVIKEESDSGLDGFINLIGIESPGLTASMAIAEMVRELIYG